MAKRLRKYRSAVIYLVLALTTLAVYWEVRDYEFVNYDDQEYVTENERVQAGLTVENIKWSFSVGHFSSWDPLTWLSHILDCELYGLNAGRHHLISLFFHIANTLLLFAVLKQMTGALWPSVFAAAAFALHPLHVESVAWISERKDVLSTFFWILTMGSYHIYVRRAGVGWYLLTLLLFAMGLMSKPMLVTLPFVLLLLDYWPLGRFENSEAVTTVSRWRIFRRLVLEKVSFFALSAVSSVITFVAQQGGGAVNRNEALGPAYRITNALNSYMTYIVKMFWPVRLTAFYPHRFGSAGMWLALIAALLLLTISVCIIRLAGKKKYLLTGWLWYLGTLVPVIGLVQVGNHSMADRYSYVPLTGLFIIIGWGFADLSVKWRFRKIILTISAVTVLAALGVCTRLQLRHWRNSVSLYEHAIEVTDNNYWAYAGLGAALCSQNKLDEGITYLKKTLQIMPSHSLAHCNLGMALARQGTVEEAIEHYKESLDLMPDDAKAESDLAEAIEDQQAVIYYNLANIYAEQGRSDEAVEYYTKVIELKPNSIIAQGRLGLLLAQQGRIEEAIGRFRAVLSERPEDYEMHFNVGVLLERQGKTGEAIAEYEQALKINPDYGKAIERLEAALSKQDGR
jgi:Tfp pilus assembly protein PilF